MQKFSRIILLLAGLVFVGGLSLFLVSLRPDTITVYEPTHAIGAYQRIQNGDLVAVKVLKDPKTPGDITSSSLKAQLKKQGKVLFFDIAVSKGERVDRRHLQGNKLGTLSVVVAPTERVVAVSASVLGSVAGIVRPGDVVSVVGGNGAKLAEYAKVISIGVGSAAGEGVVSSNTSTAGKTSSSGSSSASSGNLTLLLAVATDEAEALANSNQGVVLIYNPFCKTKPNGVIEAIDQAGASSACPQSTGSPKPAATSTSTPTTDSTTGNTTTSKDSGSGAATTNNSSVTPASGTSTTSGAG
jgi:hypothetical protein